MANHVKGEVGFSFKGKDYTLVFTNDALIQLEDAIGEGIVAITMEVQRWTTEPIRVRLKWIRAMFWASLREHHPQITLKEAGEMIRPDGSENSKILEVLAQALNKAFGEPETKDARPTTEAGPNGTGQPLSKLSSASDIPSNNSGASLRAS